MESESDDDLPPLVTEDPALLRAPGANVALHENPQQVLTVFLATEQDQDNVACLCKLLMSFLPSISRELRNERCLNGLASAQDGAQVPAEATAAKAQPTAAV